MRNEKRPTSTWISVVAANKSVAGSATMQPLPQFYLSCTCNSAHLITLSIINYVVVHIYLAVT